MERGLQEKREISIIPLRKSSKCKYLNWGVGSSYCVQYQAFAILLLSLNSVFLIFRREIRWGRWIQTLTHYNNIIFTAGLNRLLAKEFTLPLNYMNVRVQSAPDWCLFAVEFKNVSVIKKKKKKLGTEPVSQILTASRRGLNFKLN